MTILKIYTHLETGKQTLSKELSQFILNNLHQTAARKMLLGVKEWINI